MTTTLIISIIFAAIVFAGNIWYAKKNGDPVNWLRGGIMAAASFILVNVIGLITE
jgi:hypothetical protein